MDKKSKTGKMTDNAVNDILVGGKGKRGKKSSVADAFENMGVPMTTIKKEPVKTVSKKNSNKKSVEPETSQEEPYTKNGYVRPAVTLTDQLSTEQIAELLEDYIQVKDIYQVPLGVHLRYFVNIDGKMVFRRGGLLHNNKGLPDFVILAQNPTGKPGWSVQVKDTLFYRKMTLNEIKTAYQNIIDELFEKNKKLKEENKKLKERL
jgi:hypothetical protein